MTDPRSWWSVQTSVVARAMLRSSLKEGEGGVLEHKDVVALGKEQSCTNKGTVQTDIQINGLKCGTMLY